MELSAARAPYEELIQWACRSVSRLYMPADRPWYLAPPPRRNVPHWEYQCHCRRQPVRVQRFQCVGGNGWIYLGQCPRCQAIVWSYLDPSLTPVLGR
jgi:predicted SprT family Zn-dependent metalloprotease